MARLRLRHVLHAIDVPSDVGRPRKAENESSSGYSRARVHKMVVTERMCEAGPGGVMHIQTVTASITGHVMQFVAVVDAYCITVSGRDDVASCLELALHQPSPQSGSADAEQLGSLGLVAASRVQGCIHHVFLNASQPAA